MPAERAVAVLALGVGDAPDHALGDRDGLARGLPGQEERELVSAEPERLAVLAEARRRPDERLVSDGMAVEIVDLLEVVHVEQAEGERVPRLSARERLAFAAARRSGGGSRAPSAGR